MTLGLSCRAAIPGGVAATVVALCQLAAQVPDSGYIEANYRKREYQIPMRDGVKLFAAVYTPRDTTRTYPILITRTPYGARPYGLDAYPERLGPAASFAPAGYIFVSQDVRGRYRSEGRFVHMTPHRPVKRGPSDVDESTDTYDTIEWLIEKVPGNNGRAGLWGISYSGFFAAAGMIDAHPALKAVSPQAPQADWFMGDDTHHNGAFFLVSTFDFMAACGKLGSGSSMRCGGPFDYGTSDGYQFFLDLGPLSNVETRFFKGQVPGWTEMMEHETYDAFWRERNILPHLKSIRPAVLTVGGLYDANNFYGALHVFLAIEEQSPETDNSIVIGPWSHGQWYRDDGAALGPLRFGSKTGAEFRDRILLPFFETHLKGASAVNWPKAYVYETGGNAWRASDVWPPRETDSRSIHLNSGKTLSFTPPAGGGGSEADEYVSDPARPVPFLSTVSTEMNPDYMAQDQRFSAERPDVLVYQGEVLPAELTIAGPVRPKLRVSTTGTDGDWVIKLIDVHPDGFQEMVRGDVMRAKFRRSFERPEPLSPGQVTELEFVMPDVLHTFKKGHRLMVHVQSSWFPLVDRNPQKFVNIYRARAEDFQKATMRVHRGSRIEVRVLVRKGGV